MKTAFTDTQTRRSGWHTGLARLKDALRAFTLE
jgi:hypothetical protein